MFAVILALILIAAIIGLTLWYFGTDEDEALAGVNVAVVLAQYAQIVATNVTDTWDAEAAVVLTPARLSAQAHREGVDYDDRYSFVTGLAWPYGRCDRCGTSCDADGCRANRAHPAALDASDWIELDVEGVLIGNDPMTAAGWDDTYAVAAICYTPGHHQGVHFVEAVLPGETPNSRAAYDRIQARIDADPRPYTIIAAGDTGFNQEAP